MAENIYTELFRFEVCDRETDEGESQGLDSGTDDSGKGDGEITKPFPAETFHVIRFRGTEALSSLFCFDIDLVSKNPSLDLQRLLSCKAKLTVKRPGGTDAVFYGLPSEARQEGHFRDYTYYTVRLQPSFARFTQIVQSAVFLNKTAPEVVKELLESERFFKVPYQMALVDQSYPKQELAIQYQESLYDYITWRMEQQGAYYYFDSDGDRVIFADNPQSHRTPEATLYYSPVSNLEGSHRDEVVTSFSLSQTFLPKQVVVRSYNWHDPNTAIVSQKTVSDDGIGDVYLAHEGAEDQAQADRIAEIRAQELLCHSRIFSGVSSSPVLRPGVVFTLDRHYNDQFNGDYMVTEVTHRGSQEAYISLGLGIPLHGAAEHYFYSNDFRSIPSSVTYRPPRKAHRAKVTGVTRAFIYGDGTEGKPEQDENGRYKVSFPFDVSDQKGGNYAWVRMSQLSVGQNSGLSLPLSPGVEVMIAFEDGDPDKPYIAGALANGETGSITGPNNVDQVGISSQGGNALVMNNSQETPSVSTVTKDGCGCTTTSTGTETEYINKADSALRITSTTSHDFAGMLQNKFCSFKDNTLVTSSPTFASALSAVASGVNTMIGHIMEGLRKQETYKDEKTNIGYGADAVSMVLQCISAIGDYITGSRGLTSYNVALNASADTASSKLQVTHSTAQMVLLFVSMCFDGISMGADIASAGADVEAGDKKEYHDKEGKPLYFDKDYKATTNKAEAVRSLTTKKIAETLPSFLSAMVSAVVAANQKQVLGGVLLNSKDSTVNINANKALIQHSDQGILLHSAFRNSATQVTSNPMNSLAVAEAVAGKSDKNEAADASTWGIKLFETRNEKGKKINVNAGLAADFLSSDDTFLDAQKFLPKGWSNTPGGYVALAGDLTYRNANIDVSVFRESSTYVGDSYSLRVGDKGATTYMAPAKWATFVPGRDANSAVYLGTVAEMNDWPKNITDKTVTGLVATGEKASLVRREASSVTVDDTAVEAKVTKVENQSTLIKSSLKLTQDTATLTAKRVNIGTDEDGSLIDISGKDVKICHISFNKVKLKASENQPLDIQNGAMKVTP